MAGVQFSRDGALLIGHSASLSCFIVVFNSATGAIQSVRTYSTANYDNYNYLVKSIIIGSGTTPMAYVLSMYQDSTCTGQHFIKFNPLEFSATPVWAKLTTGSCNHLGLIFGRTESLLYAFSEFNSMATLSSLDSDGYQQWSYALSNGLSNTLLYFKAIDSSTDMVVATSKVEKVIKYSRILSSSASPYSVRLPDSQTYEDTTTLYSQMVRGLYISSLSTALALI